MTENWDRWYEKNREKLAEKRRERYRSDPAYRESVLDRSKKNRGGRERTGRCVRYFSGPNGEVCLITIRTFAELIGRCVQTVNLWQRTGVLPRTPFVTDTNIRYYTPKMAEVVRGVIDSGLTRKVFAETVVERWRDVGIPVQCENLECALKVFIPEFVSEEIKKTPGSAESKFDELPPVVDNGETMDKLIENEGVEDVRVETEGCACSD